MGLSSLIVARPRVGVRHQGVARGGPADYAAWQLANALVANPHDAPALEVTALGPTLLAQADHWCSLMGAPFQVRINSRAVEAGGSFFVAAGETLQIGGTPTGIRAILAVGGGFTRPTILGSQSAFEPIVPGERLTVNPSAGAGRGVRLPTATVADLFGESATTLLAMPGPEQDWFPGNGLFGMTFPVETQSNRMGVRLTGELMPHNQSELRSGPVAMGTVQVARGGGPIVLGVEGQTIGGYPRIAQVVRASWDAIGQLRPGTAVHFEPVTPIEAEARYHARQTQLTTWLHRLALRQ